MIKNKSGKAREAVEQVEITAVEQTKRGRFSLFLDGAFRFSVCKEVYLTTELSPGTAITEERLEEVRLLDETASAKEKALTLLSYTALSRGMLREKLRRHYGAAACETAVARMAELGLLDDADYAVRLAADMQHLRGYSLRRIRFELEKRKLSRENIDAALAALDVQNEAELIAEIIKKKHSAKLAQPQGEAKIAASLQRQGFAVPDIREGLRMAREEMNDEE